MSNEPGTDVIEAGFKIAPATVEHSGDNTSFATEKTVTESIEQRLQSSFLVRDDSEAPMDFETGVVKSEVERPRVINSFSSYERKQTDTAERSQLYLDSQPQPGTILEIALPNGKTLAYEVTKPLVKITNPNEPSQKAALERQNTSVYLRRLMMGDPAGQQKIDTAKAENKYRSVVVERRETKTKTPVLVTKSQ